MPNIEEQYLLKRLKEGDIKALEVIFDQHYNNLCRYLLLLFKNQLLVEHIAQDIFIYLWEKREKLEIKTSLESYLFAAGRYKALNKIRNIKRQEEIKKDLSLDQNEATESVETELEIKELECLIDDAVSTLPERCQQIFRLSRDKEMSYKEIAEFLDISINTVEGQMAIALKKLRKILRPFYFQIFFTL
jgi:RNA polymerase sigma-70 factor, ECF subfamily